MIFIKQVQTGRMGVEAEPGFVGDYLLAAGQWLGPEQSVALDIDDCVSVFQSCAQRYFNAGFGKGQEHIVVSFNTNVRYPAFGLKLLRVLIRDFQQRRGIHLEIQALVIRIEFCGLRLVQNRKICRFNTDCGRRWLRGGLRLGKLPR